MIPIDVLNEAVEKYGDFPEGIVIKRKNKEYIIIYLQYNYKVRNQFDNELIIKICTIEHASENNSEIFLKLNFDFDTNKVHNACEINVKMDEYQNLTFRDKSEHERISNIYNI